MIYLLRRLLGLLGRVEIVGDKSGNRGQLDWSCISTGMSFFLALSRFT